MQEIIERDDTSNHESSDALAKELHIKIPKKKQKDRDSPERIIIGEGAEPQVPGMGIVDSQTITMPDSGLGFNKLKEQVNN